MAQFYSEQVRIYESECRVIGKDFGDVKTSPCTPGILGKREDFSMGQTGRNFVENNKITAKQQKVMALLDMLREYLQSEGSYICARCCRTLEREQKQPPNEFIACHECLKVVYCSNRCRKLAAPAHAGTSCQLFSPAPPERHRRVL